MSLKDEIVKFLSGLKCASATLKDIYTGIKDSDYTFHTNTPDNSIRRAIYSNKDTFKQVCKGVYMLIGENSSSLLINGDGRGLSEIEDGSIDGCIITDHPWQDFLSLKGGNRDMASYETFRYTCEDFAEKYRVLKEGSYLIEFLPVESSTNFEYLYQIKKMAQKCGFRYYTTMLFKNAPANSVNTGRVTKGVQQIVVFSKGKPRKLSPDNVQGYCTHSILHYELEYHVARAARNRNHQAEKPVELYEYLIKQFTEESEVCLDQFGGSCNMLQAAINTNRFGIVYEICKEFIDKAVKRFGCEVLYAEPSET